MSDTFISFRKIPFSNKLAKEELEQLLTEHNVPFEVEENSYAFDSSFANNEFSKDYHFKISPKDFLNVNQLLEKQTNAVIQQLPPDYYLFSFSKEELIEVVHKPDEWNEIDVALATQLLSKQGFELSNDEREEIKEERTTALSRYSSVSTTALIIAYACAIFSGAFIIPFGNIAFYAGPATTLFGIALMRSKKTLPDGISVFSYEPKIRLHGLIIGILGTTCAFLWLYYVRYIRYS